MARARFIAPHHESYICEAFGRRFAHGQWVDLKGLDAADVKTLSENPTFEAELDPEPAPRKVKGASGTQPESSDPAGEA